MAKILYNFSKTLVPCCDCPPPDKPNRGTNEVRDEQT